MENDDYYRAIIRTAMDGFWLLDGQGRFLDVNDAYCELIGYPRAELLNMSIADIEANETPGDVAQHLAALKIKGSGRFETRHRTREGRLIGLEISANYEAGQGRIFVFLRDVTARQHTEQSLMMREMSLNSLLDLSQHASTMSEREIIQLALEEVERLTASEIGYLHFINSDQNSIQLYTWSRRTLSQCTAAYDAHYPLAQAGIWADCARLKHPVVHNDYQNYPDKKGLPAGHTHLIRHLSVPVVEEDAVKLILGVGNKRVDYDDSDMRQLLLTAQHLWRIVRRKRAENLAHQETQRVATLARVAARLNAHLDLPTVLQTICEESLLALDFPAASVCMYSPQSEKLCHAAVSDQVAAPPAELQSELLSLLDQADWRQDVFVLAPIQPRQWISALAAARLMRADQVLGVLAVYSLESPRPWDEDDAALLRGLANQAAQAITNARLFTEISQSQEQLQTLSRRLVEVQEGERRHIARELHDEVGQVLTAVKINLQMLRKQLATTQQTMWLDENVKSVQRALEQVRNLSLDLRPSILDDLGLGAALEWYTHRLAQMTGVNLQLSLPPGAPRWSPTIEITCFRVAQEALTNILRHAEAQHVQIDLQYTPVEMRMQVSDDGRGFEPAAARLRAAHSGTSVGLLSMAERVALAGGQLEIISAPGQGTSVRVMFCAPTQRDDHPTEEP